MCKSVVRIVVTLSIISVPQSRCITWTVALSGQTSHISQSHWISILDKADRRVPMYNWGVIYAIEDYGQYLLSSMMAQTDWTSLHMWPRQTLLLSHSTKDDIVLNYTSTLLTGIWTSLLCYASLLVTTLAKIFMHLWYKRTFLYAVELVVLAHRIQHCINSLLLSLFSMWMVLSPTFVRYGPLYIMLQYLK